MNDEHNLLPESVQKRRFVVLCMKCWGFVWLASVVVFVGVCIVHRPTWQDLENTAVRLAAQAEPLRKIQSEQRAMRQEAQLIQKRESWMTDSGSNQPLTLIGIVSQAASSNRGRINVEDLKLTSFERPVAHVQLPATETRSPKTKGKVERRMQLHLNGYAVDDLAVASFVAVLREAKVFESVELRSSVSQLLRNHEARRYEVTCVY